MHYVTHFDSDYCAQGMALIASLQEYCEPFELTILALDAKCEMSLRYQNLGDNVRIIGLSEFEMQSPHKLHVIRQQKTWKEYCWLLEPLLCQSMLKRGVDEFVYVDADSFFFSTPSFSRGAAVALSPHNFPAGQSHREATVGRFNFGFGYFASWGATVELVNNWIEDTLRQCDGNSAGHQPYLDKWPDKLGPLFDELPPTINVGPWQHAVITGDPPMIGGEPLIHMHFHECRKRLVGGRNPVMIRGQRWNLTDYDIPAATRESVYEPYLEVLGRYV